MLEPQDQIRAVIALAVGFALAGLVFWECKPKGWVHVEPRTFAVTAIGAGACIGGAIVALGLDLLARLT